MKNIKGIISQKNFKKLILFLIFLLLYFAPLNLWSYYPKEKIGELRKKGPNPELENREKILEEMNNENFNFTDCVLLEEKVKFTLVKGENLKPSLKEKTKIIKYSPNEVIIKATLPKNGFLVLSDTYYPGWKVFIDGKENKIYRANYIFRAVYLTKGEHIVRFVYDPLSFKIGLIITLTTIFILIIYFIIVFLKRFILMRK